MLKGIIVGVITSLFLISVAVHVVVPFTTFYEFWGTIFDALIPDIEGLTASVAALGAAARPRARRRGQHAPILRRYDRRQYEDLLARAVGRGEDE